MAKGRKLTTSRSERYLGSYGYGHTHGSSGTGISELGEEDVWAIVDVESVDRDDDDNDNDNDNPPMMIDGAYGEWSSRAISESNGGYASTIRPRRRGPREESLAGGLSLAFDDSGKTASSPRIVQQFRGRDSMGASPRGRQMATSAPMNVPDWRQILRVDSIESMHDSEDWLDDRDSEMVPPHEYLAREFTRSGKMAATSVFEGVGRTLKGRDMSRVRDAVWSQTGFDG